MELLQFAVIRYGELSAPFGPSAGKHLPSVGRLHSFPESMYGFLAPVMGLKGPFHCVTS
jgi:hypothetical protein